MEREEKNEELKRRCLTEIQHRDSIPQGVVDTIRKDFNEIFRIYDSSIPESELENAKTYIQGKFDELKAEINNIGDLRKSDEIEQTYLALQNLQSEVDNEIKKEESNKDEMAISEIDLNNNQRTSQLINLTVDSLKNVQNYQNRLLDFRGYSNERIEQINGKVNEYIYGIKTRKAEDILNLLKNDEENLKNEINGLYGEYIRKFEEKGENKDIDSIQEEKHLSDKEVFRQDLDSGKSLEEQKEYVENVLKEQAEQKEEQNENQIETLPEDLLI